MKPNQKGFSVLELFIVIVVLGLLGTVGWFIYDRQKSETGSTDEAQTNQQEQSIKDTESTPQTTAQPPVDEGFYEINEWGIKIALHGYDKVQFDVKNQSGHISGFGPYDGYADPSFKSTVLQDKSCEPGVTLYRSKTKFASRDDALKKIGEYYYVVTGGPGSCNNESDNQLKVRFLHDVSNPDNITAL